MRVLPLVVLNLVLILVAGCQRDNPAFCCVTEAECAAAGVDEVRRCSSGEACIDNNCVSALCNSSADCHDPLAPHCENGLCAPGCELDEHCAGIDGLPYCVDAACVECKFSAQCPSSAEICDPSSQTCRGCNSDDECASGVCIEADGRCASQDEVVYVSSVGSDAGDCTSSAPCQTISYAVTRTGPTRSVVRLLGGAVSAGTPPIALPSIVIDGTNTSILGSTYPLFTVALSKKATLEGIRVTTTDGSTIASATTNGTLRIVRSSIDRGRIQLDSGTVEIDMGDLVSSTVDCATGNVIVTRSELDRSTISTNMCRIDVKASTFHGFVSGQINSAIRGTAALVTIENNVFAETNELCETIYLYAYAPGSTVRFNTFVNSAQAQGALAVFCGGGADDIDVSNNIFAYNSAMPLLSCTPRYSLFDVPGMPAASAGPNNVVSEAALFFKDRVNGDFHLAATSPALGIGEAGLATVDKDGNPRPMPAGSKPDVGAYEAPN